MRRGKMKQFASWFTHGVPGGAGLRKAIYEAKEDREILKRVEDFFEARLRPWLLVIPSLLPEHGYAQTPSSANRPCMSRLHRAD